MHVWNSVAAVSVNDSLTGSYMLDAHGRSNIEPALVSEIFFFLEFCILLCPFCQWIQAIGAAKVGNRANLAGTHLVDALLNACSRGGLAMLFHQ